jgi:hypothetical protein
MRRGKIRNDMTRTTVAALAVLSLPALASASLGGSVATVESDRAQMKSALVRIARSDAYTVHEILTPTGTTIREYYSASGIVFGVAWDGEWPPDMRQLFGTHFDHYQRAVQAGRRARKARGSLAIDDDGLIVQSVGRARSFSGAAYLPALMPAGVSPSVIK